MPYSYDIFITATEDANLPHPCAYELYSAMLRLISAKDESVSDYIHNEVVAPISLSTLWTGNKIKGGLEIPKDTQAHFTLSVIDPKLTEFFNMFILENVNRNRHIYLNNVPFVFNYINTESKNTKAESYSNLNGSLTEMVLKFKSPTAFKREDKQVIVPKEDLVFRSLFRKWQKYSGREAEENVFDSMIEKVVISAFDIKSRAWKFQKVTQRGFVGNVKFEIKSEKEEEISLFNSLCNFAYYSGVGIKTTHGMGQVEIVKE